MSWNQLRLTSNRCSSHWWFTVIMIIQCSPWNGRVVHRALYNTTIDEITQERPQLRGMDFRWHCNEEQTLTSHNDTNSVNDIQRIIAKWYTIRLSLLTMNNPNQLCDVLLFVCSKMADETNLSSKLPVADRTREVWGRNTVGDALALAFRCARFCSASLILFASYSPAPFLMRPRHFVRSCAICSHDSVGMLKPLRKALRVSLYRFFWPPWERFQLVVLQRGFYLANVHQAFW